MVFVGRENELQFLNRELSRLDEGKSSVVFIDAEPGAGKTALVNTFLKQLPTETCRIAIANCDDKDGLVPYGVINRLYQSLQEIGVFSKVTDWRNNIQKITTGIGKDIIGAFVPGGNTITSVFEVASSIRDKKKPQQDSFKDDKLLLIEDILRAAKKKPLIIFWDDLQWIDSISANFIFSFCKALRQDKYPILVIGAYRPHEVNRVSEGEKRHPFADKINELRGILEKKHIRQTTMCFLKWILSRYNMTK